MKTRKENIHVCCVEMWIRALLIGKQVKNRKSLVLRMKMQPCHKQECKSAVLGIYEACCFHAVGLHDGMTSSDATAGCCVFPNGITSNTNNVSVLLTSQIITFLLLS